MRLDWALMSADILCLKASPFEPWASKHLVTITRARAPLLAQMAGKLVEAARERGVIVITAGKGDIVRLVPPLVVTEEEIEQCCRVLGEVAKEVLV